MTGVGGFLGSKIRRHLQADNTASVISVGESLKTHPQTTAAALSHLGPYDKDVLVLCGASYYKGNDPAQIALMRAYNCEYTKLVIDQFMQNRGWRIVFFSSYMQLYATGAEPYADRYLQTKREVLNYISTETKASLLNLFIYDNWAVDDPRPKFVPMLLRTLQEGREFNVPAPDTLMDLCDAEALTSTIALLCLKFDDGVVSLGTGIPMSLKEVVEQFIGGLGLEDRVNFGIDVPHHNFIPYTNLTPGLIANAKL